MDRVLNPKNEKQAIYEIYRACRLCGAGAGYKMPIIQNVVDLEGDGIELRQKIKECVQIEVSHTDRMPPLICELCVDKVNDFYQFLDMCRQTNRRTRLRLGLALHASSEKCTVGAAEPLDVADSGAELPTKPRSRGTRLQKEAVEGKVKIENAWLSRRTGAKPREPSPVPKRTTRQHAEPPPLPPQPKEPPNIPTPTKSVKLILQKTEEPTPPEKCKLKRPREKDIKLDTPPPAKKVKMVPEPAKPSKPGPKSSKNTQKEPKEPPPPKVTPKQIPKPASKKDLNSPPLPKPTPVKTLMYKAPASKPPVSITPASKTPTSKTPASRTLTSKTPASKTPTSKIPASKTPTSKALAAKPESLEPSKAFFCGICQLQMKNSQRFGLHNLKHQPTFTSAKHACNACELWFPGGEEAGAHHRAHRARGLPYKCTRCYGYFKLQQEYELHFAENLCLSVYEVPDAKCWECWRTFPTNKLMEEHRCLGEDGRPGGTCSKCKRNYSLLKNLRKHEQACTHRKKGEMSVEPKVQASLLPMQVRIARCDPLLRGGGHVDVARLSHRYGLDSKWRYPYLPSPTATSFNHVASVGQTVKEVFITDSRAHWDSDDNDSTDSPTLVGSLSSISLKTINSKKRGPKSKRNVEFKDDSERHLDMSRKIDSILDSLANEDGQTSCSYDSDTILDKGTAKDGAELTSEEAKGTANGGAQLTSEEAKGTAKGGAQLTSEEAKSSVTEDNPVNNDSQTSCDSDSILYKNCDKSDAKDDNKDVTNDAPASSENFDAVSEKLNDTPDKLDVTSDKLDVTSDKLDVTPDKLDVTSDKLDVTSDKLDVTSDKLDVTSDKLDVTSDQLDVTYNKLDVKSDQLDVTSDQMDVATEKLEIVKDSTLIGSENEAKSSIGNINDESMKEIDDKSKSVAENDEASIYASKDTEIIDEKGKRDDLKERGDVDASNSGSGERKEQNKIEISNGSTDSSKELSKDLSKTNNYSLTNDDVQKNDNVDSNNQSVQDSLNEDTLASSVREQEDKLGNINLVSDNIVTSGYDKVNVKENYHKGDTASNNEGNKHFVITNFDKFNENDNFSKIDEITNKILKENETSQENLRNDSDDKLKDYINVESHQNSDPHSDSMSLNSGKSYEINGFDIRDKFNVDDLNDEDKMLIEDLDAQIGENEQKTIEIDQRSLGSDEKIGNNDKIGDNDQMLGENNESYSKNDHMLVENEQNGDGNDQKMEEHSIDDVIKKQNDLKSLELDAISDEEFNFDA